MRTLPLLLLVLAAPLAAQSVHMVPEEHATIQEAADAAADGDTILISAGVYAESVTVTSKNDLLIQGTGQVILDPPSGVGLTLDGCTGCSVERIRVGGGAPYGIHLIDCTGCVLSRCRVELSATDGIRLDGGHDDTIEKCLVTDAGNDGIALGAGSVDVVDHCLITGCKLVNPGDDGVAVNGSSNEIAKCTVLAPQEDGLVVDDFTTGTLNSFHDCRVVKPAFRGLVLTGDANVCSHCTVVQSGDDDEVAVLEGTGNEVLACRLVKSAFGGVFVDIGTDGTHVHGCRISAPSDDGIHVEGDGVEVLDCKVVVALDAGFVLAGDAGEWSGNVAIGSHGDGFLIDVTASGNHLAGNKAVRSQGVDLDDESGGANTIDADNSFKTNFP